MWSSYKTYKLILEINSNTVDLKDYHIDSIISVNNNSEPTKGFRYNSMTFNYNTNTKMLYLLQNVDTPIKIEIYYLSNYMLRQDKLERILCHTVNV